MRTLLQLTIDEGARYPEGSTSLSQDTYMDDILTGAASREEAQELQRQLTELCKAGGFPLRKWSSNHAEILKEVPVEHRLQRDIRSWQPQESHATLGLQWHPNIDAFSYVIPVVEMPTITKRAVLSMTARLFDPLGWLAPVVVRAKILFQSTWLMGIDWDTLLDGHHSQLWEDLRRSLPQLAEIRVPRYVPTGCQVAALEWHGFADASERAYAAVIYLRTITGTNKNQVSLIAAKTKVAPIKQVTLPRLELCAATLLVRLMAHVRPMIAKDAPVHLWTDSTVALQWIQGHPSRWKTYVANRVSEIQTTQPGATWHHLPGVDNPADCASRGISPSELVAHPLWWQGPSWLLAGAPPPAARVIYLDEDELPDKRTRSQVAVVRHTPMEPEEITRFSSFTRLNRVIAWCLRWPRRGRTPPKPASNSLPADILSAEELEEARLTLIRLVQSTHWSQELKSLIKTRALIRGSSLLKLTPFIDPHGILRVGGRLKHSLLAYDAKHPVILPSSSHFTRLIVEALHRRTLHGGVQLTLSAVRQLYWVPRGRALVKAVLHRCNTCVRWRAATPQQRMGDLPSRRVTPARPFLHTGVDYAGPIMLRTTKGRGHRAYKGFLVIFTCMSTRAVHLEAVSDYSADAFLAALRRFTSRRGLCHSLTSDCGTNFVGADKQLQGFFFSGSPELRRVAKKLANERIIWRFNPPSAPHFGGLWEAAVKSVKHHLRRVLGEASLTYEELSTLLAQVEACLNSRPLQALTDDPEDTAALTPGHFLIGTAMNAVPETCLSEVPSNRLTRWQMLQKMRDHFWERWSREYVHSLLPRPKWKTSRDDIQPGRLCLIRNEITPPTRWPLARIAEVHPGDDGLVRVVTVRTASSELKRPVVKLVLLPSCSMDDDDEHS